MILAQEYTNKSVSPLGGMQEMKILFEQTGISRKIFRHSKTVSYYQKKSLNV